MGQVPTAPIEITTEDDIPQLAALVNRAFAIERFFMDRDRTTPEQVGAYLASGRFLMVRADEGALAACGYVERGEERFDDPFATRPAHYILMSKELAS